MNAPDFSPVRFGPEDVAPAAALERLCFAEPWSERALELFLGPDAVAFAVRNGTGTVGYGGMMLAPGEGQITNIAVHPDLRRRGIGRAILRALLDEAGRRGLEQVVLEVRVSNAGAIALYEGMGFLRAGLRKRFYRNPVEDAIVMVKPLRPEEKTAD